jgi:hypothetical protein
MFGIELSLIWAVLIAVAVFLYVLPMTGHKCGVLFPSRKTTNATRCRPRACVG